MKAPPVSKSVLITGCSSGIGRATALLLRDAGWSVLPTARKEQDLASLRADGFDPLPLDLCDSGSVRACAEEALSRCGGQLGALVNNAGFGQPGALEDLSREQMRQQFEVNVFGLLELTNLLLPSMIDAGAGRVVHLSSVVGRIALPFMGIYSASKFALEAIGDSQRVELSGTGVHVALVEPGPIETAFRSNAIAAGGEEQDTSRFSQLYRSETQAREARNGGSGNPFALPPEAVGRAVLHALSASRPKRRYHVTFPARFGAFASRFLPDAVLDAILIRELGNRLRKAGSKA